MIGALSNCAHLDHPHINHERIHSSCGQEKAVDTLRTRDGWTGHRAPGVSDGRLPGGPGLAEG